MDTVLPITHSALSPVEAPFYDPNGPRFSATLALGAQTRVQGGKCMERHQSTGACWGTFHGEASRYVDNRDHPVSCVLAENYVSAVNAGNAQDADNMMTQFSSIPGSTLDGSDPRASAGPQFSSTSVCPPRGTAGCGGMPPAAMYGPFQSVLSVKTPPQASYGNYSSCPNCGNAPLNSVVTGCK